ncbi:MAG: hypothetical protein V1800_11590 [Candidatus Latescibacterota bacterium]
MPSAEPAVRPWVGAKGRHVSGHLAQERQTHPDYCDFGWGDGWSTAAHGCQTLPTNPFPPLPAHRERSADLLIEEKSGQDPKRTAG